MKIALILFIITSILNASQDEKHEIIVNDGPYIYIENDKLIEKRIINNKLQIKEIRNSDYDLKYEKEKSFYSGVSKIAALSDVHGQHDLFIRLLKANKIITEDERWNFGKGHFVITGDFFDRGDKVTENLWFIYNLEKQAAEAGGKVHYILGNHEFMVLYEDKRYIHEKYLKSAEILGSTYAEIFNENTILGRWLRSKSTIIQIDNKLYLHGGISNHFLDHETYDLDLINDKFRQSIGMLRDITRHDKNYSKLYDKYGPIWFRGYFKDTIPEVDIKALLKRIDVTHIIVGHTSMKTVQRYYNGKIYVVDSSMKRGKYGELLMIEGDKFKRFDLSGKELDFEEIKSENGMF